MPSFEIRFGAGTRSQIAHAADRKDDLIAAYEGVGDGFYA